MHGMLALVARYQRRTASLNEQALVYASENSFTMVACNRQVKCYSFR